MAADSYPSKNEGYHCSAQPLHSGQVLSSLATPPSHLSRIQSANWGPFVHCPHSHHNPIVLFHHASDWPHC